MKKIEIDANLATSLLITTATIDFRLSDDPFKSFIKADTTLNVYYVLGIISEEELRNFQMMLNINYSCFTEIQAGEAKRKEGDTN